MSKKKNLALSLLKIEIIINHKLPIENGRFKIQIDSVEFILYAIVTHQVMSLTICLIVNNLLKTGRNMFKDVTVETVDVNMNW